MNINDVITRLGISTAGLSYLDLSNKNIADLTGFIPDPALLNLQLRGNALVLSASDVEILNNSRINTLDISHNKLVDGGFLKTLTVDNIVLSSNLLTDIEISQPHSSLRIDYNQLKTVVTTAAIVNLDLSGNNITNPTGINAASINLSYNNIEDLTGYVIPDDVAQLNLSNNFIATIATLDTNNTATIDLSRNPVSRIENLIVKKTFMGLQAREGSIREIASIVTDNAIESICFCRTTV